MNCPKCNKPITKVGQEVTSNMKTGNDLRQYDKVIYLCKDDDIWVATETPIAETVKS